MKKFFVASLFFCLFFLTGIQTVSAQVASTDLCTGEIRTDLVAAQRCANLAQTQGTARGYNITCKVEQNGLGGFTDPTSGQTYVLNPVCSVNSSSYQYGAMNIVGFSAFPKCTDTQMQLISASGSSNTASILGCSNAMVTSVNPGWDILKTDIAYGSAFAQCGGKAPYGSVVNGVSVYSCTAPAGALPLTTPNASSIKASSDPITSSISALKDATLKAVYTPLQSVAQHAIDKLLGNITSPELTSIGGCFEFTNTLQVGASGSEVTALTTALKQEGFLDNVQNTFDANVMSAVKQLQEVHSAEILTIQGLTQGTGVVGVKTKEYLNSHCIVSNSSSVLPIVKNPIVIPSQPIVTVPSSCPVVTRTGVKNGKYSYTFTQSGTDWKVTLNNPAYSTLSDAYYVPANFSFTAPNAADLNRQNQGRFNYLVSLPGSAVGNTEYANLFGSFNNAYYDWDTMTKANPTCTTSTNTGTGVSVGTVVGGVISPVASNSIRFIRVSVADWDTLPLALREIVVQGPNNTVIKPVSISATDFDKLGYQPASNLIDGNENTIWRATKTSGTDLQVIILDLGQSTVVDRVKIINYALTDTREFVVEVSTDGHMYTQIADVKAQQNVPIVDNGVVYAVLNASSLTGPIQY